MYSVSFRTPITCEASGVPKTTPSRATSLVLRPSHGPRLSDDVEGARRGLPAPRHASRTTVGVTVRPLEGRGAPGDPSGDGNSGSVLYKNNSRSHRLARGFRRKTLHTTVKGVVDVDLFLTE